MDTTTALTIVAPPEFHNKINLIRSVNDKAYPRWMPHMNLLFPFVDENNFKTIKDKLESSLKDFGPMELNMNKIEYFVQGKNITFHISPDNDSKLQELFKIIRKTLPDIKIKHQQFHPHLTIGQFKKNELDAKLTELNKWLGSGFIFKIEKICLIKRKDEKPFEIITEVLLKN